MDNEAIRVNMRMHGSRVVPLEKSQRGSKQYWAGTPGKSQSYQTSIQCLARQRNANKMVFGSSLSSSTKKTETLTKLSWPPLTKLSGSTVCRWPVSSIRNFQIVLGLHALSSITNFWFESFIASQEPIWNLPLRNSMGQDQTAGLKLIRYRLTPVPIIKSRR